MSWEKRDRGGKEFSAIYYVNGFLFTKKENSKLMDDGWNSAAAYISYFEIHTQSHNHKM